MEEIQDIFKDNNIYYNILCFFISENKKFFEGHDGSLYWKTVFHMYALYHHFSIAIYAMGLELEKFSYEEVITLRRFKIFYLTGWNFSFQSIFLLISLAYDLMEWAEKTHTELGKKLNYLRDVIFSGLVVPFTLFVTTMFWTIYWIDRELVFPKVFDKVVPWWFNHCVHTNILIVIAIETVLQPRRYPRHLKVETILYCLVTFGYAVVYYSIYFIAHRWLYDVFGVMTWWQVCLFQIAIWISTHVFYKIQFPINRLFHGKSEGIVSTRSVEFLHEKAINDFGEIIEENPYRYEVSEKNYGLEQKLTSFEKLHLEGKVNSSFEGNPKDVREKHLSFDDSTIGKNDNTEFSNGNDVPESNGTKIIINGVKLETYNGELVNNGNQVHQMSFDDHPADENHFINKVFDPNEQTNDTNGIPKKAFEKSWSLKYRSVRNDSDNSSL